LTRPAGPGRPAITERRVSLGSACATQVALRLKPVLPVATVSAATLFVELVGASRNGCFINLLWFATRNRFGRLAADAPASSSSIALLRLMTGADGPQRLRIAASFTGVRSSISRLYI